MIGLVLQKLSQNGPSYAWISSMHWKFFFHVTWFVQWPHHWIWNEKLPQNESSYARIQQFVPMLWRGLLPCQLICMTSQLVWQWKTTPKQNELSFTWICPLVPQLCERLLPCQLIRTVTSALDYALKTTAKWALICLNPSIGSQVMGGLLSCQQICTVDLTIGLGMKNYPKISPHMPDSVHWFPSYAKVFFHVSWYVQWPQHCILH